MLRGLYLTLAYLAFMVLGASAPFVMTLGYVWVDGADPQYLSYGSGLLPRLPISLIMGAAAFGSYLLADRRDPPRFNLATGLLVLFAAWVTVTTTIAEVPSVAWDKWNTAIKTLLFSAFIPFAIRSRVQIEAFLQVFLFSTAMFFIPVGLKTLISGGGYGQALSMVEFNSGLAEGSTLAAVSLMVVPIALYLSRHTLLLGFTSWRRVGYLSLCIVAVAASIGTYERTALVGLLVVGAFIWLKSRNKLIVGLLIAVAALCIVLMVSTGWTNRISTVTNYSSEGSAMGRIYVWRWTMNYVASHPLGGGFNVYLIDHIVFPDGLEIYGKAFHSIYFEVLGEHGFVGFAIFASLMIHTVLSLRRVARLTRRHADLLWAHDLASALQTALLTLLACGAFIGIAFQPFIYYLVAASVCLRHHVGKTLPAAGFSVRQPWVPRSSGATPEPAVAVAAARESPMPRWKRPVQDAATRT